MPSLESSSSVQLPAVSSGNLVVSFSHEDNKSITSSTITGNNSVTMKPISAQWTHSTNGHGVNNSTSYPNNHQIKFTRGDQTRLNRNHSATSSFGVGNINGSLNGLSAHSTSSTSSLHQKACQADPMTYNDSSSIIDLPSSTYFSRNGNSMKEQNLDEKQQFSVVNNQKMESHYAHLSINKNRRGPMSQQHVLEYMPSLISLDSNDLTRPLFCYTLQLGVTMLGSGKGCVKPPDIVLHGTRVAPQHAFVERIANEAMLHPISEETSIDGRHVKGPTPLHSGALISIGDSYFFRFNNDSTNHSQPSPKPFQQARNSNSTADRLYPDESPYAVVNNRAKGNASCSVGDVNKNLTIGEAFKSSSFGYPTSTAASSKFSVDLGSRSKTTPSTVTKPLPSLLEDLSLSARSSSVSTTTTTSSSSSSSQPSTTSDPVDHLLSETISTDSFISSNPKPHRDGLESENFVNKLARFEYLAHTQHSRPPPVLPFPTVNSVVYGDGQCYSDNSDSNSNNKARQEHDYNHKDSAGMLFPSKLVSSNMATRPSVSFNRSDQGYNNHIFYKNHALGETVSLNSNTTVVSTPESSSGSCSSGSGANGDRRTYRRAGGDGSSVTFFDDYANIGVNATTPSPASMDYDEDSSLINQYSSTIPSPDSFSSISNQRSYFSSTCNSADMNSTANSAVSTVACNGSPGTMHSMESNSPTSICSKSTMSSLGESGTMTGESLLDLRRKQSRFSPPHEVQPESLGLDEILAMCAEYEEQIAKELQEKRTMSASTSLLTSSDEPDTAKLTNGSVRSPNGNSTPTSPHYYSNGRIKTNGSLPRDPSRKAFNLTIPINTSLQNSNTHILSPKQSPTTSFASHSRIYSDAQSSMTVSPCSLASYSFTSDGKNSSSTSPTSPSSTCTSFTTSTPIPYVNQTISSANNNIDSTKTGNQTPTPDNSGMVCQSTKSPYENLCTSQQINNSNTILKYDEQHMLQQQRQRVPLSPSGIRTTTDYHRKPILLNSFDKTNNTFIPSTTFSSSTSNTSNNTSIKPVLLPSSTNSSIVGDHQSTTDKVHQQQKSKLSVSFSNSVQEFYDGKDDDDENCTTDRDRNNDSETSSDNGYDENGLDKIYTGHATSPVDDSSSYTTTTIKSVISPEASRNQLRINGSESTKPPPPSILRTISTEVQVHVQSNEKGGSVGCSDDDDGGDSSCFNGNGNNNNNFDENSSRTLSNSNHDSHGQTNLMCNNIGMNANEPPCDPNNSKKQTNGILKCRELNELVEIDATMLGCGSTSTNLQNRGESTNKIRRSGSGVDAEKCGTVLPSSSSAVISSSSLPSPTSVNQKDLTQSKGNSNNNINSCKTTTQNDSGNRIAKISPSLSSSTTLVAPTEIVGSGPGNPYPTTMPTSSSSSSSVATSSTTFGKVHNGYLESNKYVINENEGRLASIKNEIMELEQQEMEALREMEIEKALLLGEEKSFEAQTESDKTELSDLKERLAQIDESNRRWRALSLERIAEMKTKLTSSEKELQRLEKLHEEFCGSTDEETVLLERLKFQHELVEGDRKAFEDAEFHHMEEEVNKEAQREELTKTLADIGRKLLSRQFQLEQLRSHNRISINSSAKEIHNLEKRRQELIRQLRTLQQYINSERGSESPAENGALDSLSNDDSDNCNMDLEEKLKALHIVLDTSGENDTHIERIKSRSPIDPSLGGIMGVKTFETLREIERHREYLLNEQGAQMLEEERARVRELQKRVQDAVREEWEASRKSRNNQCHSLNSVGSEDSGQTISDTPTDSTGSGTDDSNDTKSGALSISPTDGSLSCTQRDDLKTNGENGDGEQLCQQMRQKTKEMAAAYEETRPLSDGSTFDDNSIVIMRDKHRVQNRPLTRYLPVRGDEDQFDLRAHIESSGHQLELCPHVIVTKTTARGFLSKLGSRFHNWNKRWFVFDRETRALTYYADKNEKKSKPRGGVHFQAIQDVYVDHLHSVKSPNPKLTFCVKTYNRVYHLLAPSPEAMRIWVDIIFTGAEGYQEFKCVS